VFGFSGFRGEDWGFKVWGSWFKVWGLGLKV